MPSVQYYNNSAPFWDWVARMEDQQNSNDNNNNNAARGQEGSDEESRPWGEGWNGFPFGGPFPHRPKGHHHGPHARHHHGGPPPPPPFEGGDSEIETGQANEKDNSNDEEEPQRSGRHGRHGHGHHGPPGGRGGFHMRGGREGSFGGRHHRGQPPSSPFERDSETEAGPSKEFGEKDNGNDDNNNNSDDEPQRPDGRRRHGHGHGRRGGPHMRGGRGGPGGFGGRGGPEGFGKRGGGRGHHFHPYASPMGLDGPFGGLAQMFHENLFGTEQKNNDGDFKPEADVFDTAESFVIHVSLPGAKKEDVGVNWDSEKSELSIAGVVHRPGDEEFLKTLAMDERKVGPFEKKVRLGSRANPAQVDVEGISARLADGVLVVDVPKLGSDDFVEVKKVDIE